MLKWQNKHRLDNLGGLKHLELAEAANYSIDALDLSRCLTRLPLQVVP